MRPETRRAGFNSTGEDKTMRKTILLLALLGATPAAANQSEFCAALGETAEGIMMVRQNGAQMSKVLELIPEDTVITEVVREITLLAFEQPLMHSDDYKLSLAREFGSSVEVLCYRSGGDPDLGTIAPPASEVAE